MVDMPLNQTNKNNLQTAIYFQITNDNKPSKKRIDQFYLTFRWDPSRVDLRIMVMNGYFMPAKPHQQMQFTTLSLFFFFNTVDPLTLPSSTFKVKRV